MALNLLIDSIFHTECIPFTSTNNQYTPAENNALAGIVMNHAVTISSATLQRIFPNLSEDPTPIIAELTTCDVLTGNPNADAVSITTVELN